MKISKVYKVASNPGTLFMLICAILSLGFTTPSFAVTGNSGPSNTLDLRGHSGEDLFKAIFLLQGDLVDEVPSLRGLRDAMRDYDFSSGESVFNAMAKTHPGYFSELEEAVNSNNHYAIESALQAGSELLILSQYSQFILSEASQGTEGMPDLSRYDLSNDAERGEAMNALSTFMSDVYDIDVDMIAFFFVGPLAVAVAVAFVLLIASVAVWVDEHRVAPPNNDVVNILQETTITKDKIIQDLVNL